VNKDTWSEKIQSLLNYLEWNYQDLNLYQEALTHSSYAHEKAEDNKHNERLEFLGDAVLELIVSDYLYNHFSHFPEGKLTKLRSDLVCEESLSRIAYQLKIGDYLRLGKGEATGGGGTRPSLLADAIEALIGALYLDVGFNRCYDKVIKLISPVMVSLENGSLRNDYKTLLQEYVQSQYGITPEYFMVGESGPDHQKIFMANVLLHGKVLGKGSGKSKKEAQQEAAREAWEKLN